MGVIYKILQWETSFARARFIDVMRTNFFFKRYSPEAFFCIQKGKERREEEKRGRKVPF